MTGIYNQTGFGGQVFRLYWLCVNFNEGKCSDLKKNVYIILTIIIADNNYCY